MTLVISGGNSGNDGGEQARCKHPLAATLKLVDWEKNLKTDVSRKANWSVLAGAEGGGWGGPKIY